MINSLRQAFGRILKNTGTFPKSRSLFTLANVAALYTTSFGNLAIIVLERVILICLALVMEECAHLLVFCRFNVTSLSHNAIFELDTSIITY